MSHPANGYERRWKVAGLSILLVIVVLGALVFRSLGESGRISAANKEQDRRIDANLARIEEEVRADCQFKFDVIELPQAAVKAHQRPTAVLITLATSAREAYLKKGCPETISSKTHRPFGPPPEIPKVPR